MGKGFLLDVTFPESGCWGVFIYSGCFQSVCDSWRNEKFAFDGSAEETEENKERNMGLDFDMTFSMSGPKDYRYIDSSLNSFHTVAWSYRETTGLYCVICHYKRL